MYHLCPGCEVETYGELLCPDCRMAGATPKDGEMREDAEAQALSAPQMQTERRSVWAWLRPAAARNGCAAAHSARN